ncbi:cytochrome P450 2K1-like isoform X1 [Anguilla rostrata]|uniref:cytochrome P450 2K1-like isoform X1 n=2 Tax=Anguilla rostrata TaxID=7938 RepID=UPI0030D3FA51
MQAKDLAEADWLVQWGTMALLEGFLPQMPPPLTLLEVVLVLFLLYLLSSTPGQGKDPPGPRPLPLLGNLLHLDLKQLHVCLCELSKKYGSVFTVHLGPKKVVVLAGYKTVKQALINYAKEFGDREISPIFTDALQGHGVTFANGNSWKVMRRFSLKNLRAFAMGKRGSEEKIIEESRHLAEVFGNFKGEPFDTTQPLKYSVSNILSAIMYGCRFDYADPAFHKMVERTKEAVRLSSSVEIMLYNLLPWLRWCCGRWLVKRTKMLKITENLVEGIKGLAQGQKDTLNSQDLRGFVDSFLVRQQEESDQPGSYFHNNNLNYTVGNLFAAGMDTTGTTLRWSLLLMAKYPHIQDQVQEELSRVIGDREPRVEDRRNLPYTDAVIHEIQRLCNILPLNFPHTTTCDVTFQGHFIKKGTMVVPLLTSVLWDEEEWETPHSFNPGHFLDEKGCFIKRDAFMPFSAGRRACVGESLARMELFLFFTLLLQRFHFTPPPGVSEDELDLTSTVGFTRSPSPHLLCAVSRT